MFGIGMPEMLMILAVALIIFGPKRLPELAKSLGRALGEFRRATSDLKQSIETDTGLGPESC
jgi:sec-independent protein translocase protein TatB